MAALGMLTAFLRVHQRGVTYLWCDVTQVPPHLQPEAFPRQAMQCWLPSLTRKRGNNTKQAHESSQLAFKRFSSFPQMLVAQETCCKQQATLF